MDRIICILTSLLMINLISSSEMDARPKAVSSIWSLSGIGIGYEHQLDAGSFIQIDFKAEMAELFKERSWKPGGTASFTWNMQIGSLISNYGSKVSLFAGPGAVIGWTDDHKAPSGLLFGLKGRLGIECLFKRNIAVSASIAPSLAMHMSVNQDMEYNMRTFRNGLIYGFIPEIGIKYCF